MRSYFFYFIKGGGNLLILLSFIFLIPLTSAGFGFDSGTTNIVKTFTSTTISNGTIAGSCPDGQAVQNTTASGVQCIPLTSVGDGSYNVTYHTWLPNYTAYNQFWYNHTSAVSGLYGIWFYNQTTPAITYADTKAATGNCPAGQVVQNTTTSGVECITPVGVGDGSFNSSYLLNENGTQTGYNDFKRMLEAPESPANLFIRLFALRQNLIVDLHARDSDGNDFTLAQDNLITAKNPSANDNLTKGQIVYISGSGALPQVSLAQANDTNLMPSIGVAFSNISNGTNGRILTVGVLYDVDTSSFSAGDRLWVSTTEKGNFTNVEPSYPNIVQRVGFVMTSDASTGKILIQTTKQQDNNPYQIIYENNQSWLSTKNATYDTWLPNYTASNKFWYNHTSAIETLYGAFFYNHTSAIENLYGKWFYNQTLSAISTFGVWGVNATKLDVANITNNINNYNHTSSVETLYGKFFYNQTLAGINTFGIWGKNATTLSTANITTGANLVMNRNNVTFKDNSSTCYGDTCQGRIHFNGTALIIKVT